MKISVTEFSIYLAIVMDSIDGSFKHMEIMKMIRKIKRSICTMKYNRAEDQCDKLTNQDVLI